MLLDLKDYFAQDHIIELWYDPNTDVYDDTQCIRVVAKDGWYQCESSEDDFEARSTVIDHVLIAAICHLNVFSDEPLSLEWLSGVSLDLDGFLRSGHRLVLSARNWRELDDFWWVNIGYEDGHFYAEQESVDTMNTDDSDEAFDIGMRIIAELEGEAKKWQDGASSVD